MTTRKSSPVLITALQSVKQEYHYQDSDIPGYDPTIHNNQATSSDYLLSTDHDHGHLSAFDHGDVVSGVNSSCTTSPHSLDFDSFMAESVGFDDGADILGFEFWCNIYNFHLQIKNVQVDFSEVVEGRYHVVVSCNIAVNLSSVIFFFL